MLDWIGDIPLWVWAVIGIVATLAFVGAIRLLVKVVRMRRHLGELPPSGKVAFWGSLLYTIFPVDLLPDPIYLDDMAVLATALFYLTRLWRRRHGNVPVPRRGDPGPKVPTRR